MNDKTKRIEFKPIVTTAKVGIGDGVRNVNEAGECSNLREVTGSLSAIGNPMTIGVAREGERLLLADAERFLMARDNVVTCDGNVVLNADGAIAGAYRVGRFIVVISENGRYYLRRSGSGYESLNPAAAFPVLRLTMTAVAASEVNISEMSFSGEYTRWQLPLTLTDTATITATARAAWRDALQAVARAGRFAGPVMARYAVRLWDDSLMWVSAPVLLGGELLTDNHAAVADVMASDGTFNACGSSVARFRSFQVGVEVLRAVDDSWLGLIKSIDIYVTEAASVINLNSTMNLRCSTSTASGSRRYLLNVAPASRSPHDIIGDLTASKWRLAASSSTVADLNNGSFTPDAVITATTVGVGYFAGATFTANHLPLDGCALAYNGRLYAAPARRRLIDTWAINSIANPETDASTVDGEIRAVLAGVGGDIEVVVGERLPDTATVNPLLSFPDVRAKRLTITIGGKTITADLQPWHDAGLAFFINPRLENNSLRSGNVTLSGETTPDEETTGQLEVMSLANPFVVEQSRTVSGSVVKALGAAARPVYSGGFGRYPIYIFTDEGVFAMPQTSAGAFGEPRLIEPSIIKTSVAPVAGRRRLWFVDKNDFLCYLEGAKVTKVDFREGVTALAWNDYFDELILLGKEGAVDVLQSSGHNYKRDLCLSTIYSDALDCLAISADGHNILDLQREQATVQHVRYLSRAIAIDRWWRYRLRLMEWNVFGYRLNLRLSLRGYNGASCHGAVISSVTASGTCEAPLLMPLLSRATRSVRAEIDGTAPMGSVVLPCVAHLAASE